MSNQFDESQYPYLVSIEAKKFRLGLKGYNVKEVDQFLSALVVEIGALQSALKAAESEVTGLKSASGEVSSIQKVTRCSGVAGLAAIPVGQSCEAETSKGASKAMSFGGEGRPYHRFPRKPRR